MRKKRTALYANAGPVLMHYDLDVENYALIKRGFITLRGTQKDPGAPKIFEYRDGVLGKEVSLTQGDGYCFGPRHLDFHPTGPWVYVSVETQNELHVYKREGDALLSEPLYKRDILSDRADVRVRQGAGTVHVHPNGRIAYGANRTRMTQPFEGKEEKLLWMGIVAY